jgi:hypothetical protein
VSKPPGGGGEENVVSMAISGEPCPEVGKPLSTWPPLLTSGFARGGSPFLTPACGGDSSMLRGSPASEVPPTVSPKDNKAAPALRSRSKKTQNRRKKGDDVGNSVRPPHIVLCQQTLFKKNFGFASSLLRDAGALYGPLSP